MPDEQISVRLASPEETDRLGDTIGSLYRSVFSQEPFLGTEDEFVEQRASFDELALQPGFQLAVALDGERYVGFAYGFLLLPGSTWWDDIAEELSREFTTETGSRTFALLDFGVLPAYRGTGTGRSLHDCVLAASGAQRATLTVQVKAPETQAIYRHWGWHRVAERPGFLGGVPAAFDVYLLPSIRAVLVTSRSRRTSGTGFG